MLSEVQIKQYRDNGFVTPIDIFDKDEIFAIRAELEGAETTWREE